MGECVRMYSHHYGGIIRCRLYHLISALKFNDFKVLSEFVVHTLTMCFLTFVSGIAKNMHTNYDVENASSLSSSHTHARARVCVCALLVSRIAVIVKLKIIMNSTNRIWKFIQKISLHPMHSIP